jgi:hypothetical protein
MRTLLLAAILYLIGVVIVLLLRPQTMFDEDGDWREFGILSKAHTVFPFWLFCIVWAVLSYCITLFFLGAPGGADHSKKHVVDHLPVDEPERSNPRSGKRSKSGRRSKPVVEAPSDNLVEPLSPIEMTNGKKAPPKPGYYILDDIGTEVNGKPRYVYYGDKPPGSIGEE